MPCNYRLYPANWKTEIVPAIKKRAGNRCEQCGIPNYCVVQWNEERLEWERNGNNYINESQSYKVAREIADGWFDESGDDSKWIVIVLTVAHLDHDLSNSDHSNLQALCQRCHNRYDVQHRKETRQAKKRQTNLFQ